MKRFFFFSAFFVLLFGLVPAAAQAGVPAKTVSQPAKSPGSLLSLHDELPALMGPSAPFTCTPFKVREQRTLPGFIGREAFDASPLHPYRHHLQAVGKPLTHVPLAHRLLFPKHYFW